MEQTMKNGQAIILSGEVRFYTMDDLVKLLNWSPATVRKLFNDPKFPSADYGKTKVVECHALISYFLEKHSRQNEKYWE